MFMGWSQAVSLHRKSVESISPVSFPWRYQFVKLKSCFFGSVVRLQSKIYLTRMQVYKFFLQFSFLSFNQQSECKVFYKPMCWLSGSLTCRLPNVMRFPRARRSLVSSVIIEWCLAPRRWGFYNTHSDAPQSVGLLWTSDGSSQRPLPDNTQH